MDIYSYHSPTTPGLGDELFAQVAERLKDSPVKLADLSGGAYVAKGKFDEVAAQLATAQQAIGEREKQFSELKKIGDPLELQETIATMQKQHKADAEKWEAERTELRFSGALASALGAANARNTKAVAALLDRNLLKLDDKGAILGLKEQLDTIRAGDPYLFADAPSEKGGAEVNRGKVDTAVVRW